MNPKLQQLLDVIHQSLQLSDDDKSAMVKSIREVDKEIEITNFKLERTEKVKRTTGILLEETIEELEQKRKAVVAQNHELEIESALERVRAQALGLRKPEELTSICEVLFATLKSLGFNDLRNTMINIHDDAAESFLNYDFSLSSGRTVTNIFYNSHPVTENQVKQIRSSTDAFVQITISGHELDEWRAYRKGMGEEDDPYLSNISALFYYLYSIGTGSIGISTYHPVTEAKLTVLKRFRNVFDFAYCRYMDVAQAEAQAKEAQIELALERVRARTMAMRQSDELAETASVLFQQIKELGFDIWSCGFCIWQKNDQVEAWMSADAGGLLHPMMIPYKEEPTHQKIYEASLLGNAGYETIWEGAELEKHYAFMQTIPSVKLAIDQLTSSGLSLPARQCYYVGFFKRGYILLITKEPNNLASEISKRFANVFDQTYTRFLDLQKVEAQAREAQIEAALERVRSRTMAMHNSTELIATAELLFDQISQLGAESLGVAFGICEPNNSMVKKWTSIGVFSIPYTVESGEQKMYEAWKNQIEMYEEIYEGKKIKEYYDTFMAFPAFREGIQMLIERGYPIPAWQKNHAAIFKYGYLLFIITKPFEETNIFIRFAKVFEQAYTRFLDLQKAEAQAREAQIEAALERVRSASMAMHSSEQLAGVIKTVTDQLQSLDFSFETANFITNFTDKGFNLWLSVPGVAHPSFVYVPYDDNAFFRFLQQGVLLKKEFDTLTGGKEEKDKFFLHFFTKSDAGNIPDERKKYVFDKPGVGFTTAFRKYFYFTIVNYEGHLHSPEENIILSRFANVFEQSYTRFLDLQKAEAQAREAQIESALERVRSRAMAMQNSDDVSAATGVMFQELHKLGIETIRCGILIIHENKTMEVWNSYADNEGEIRKVVGLLDMNIHPMLHQAFEAWRTKDENLQYELEGEDMNAYYAAIAKSATYQIPDYRGLRDTHYCNLYFFEEGSIYTFTPLPHNTETQAVMKKFTAVFSLTFRRYQDLKTAEAQKREAEIQLALERVRARTMAMQRSEELAETCELLFEEFRKLHIVKADQQRSADRTTIGIFNEAERTYDLSITNLEGKKLDHTFHLSIDEPINIAKVYAAWKQGKPLLVIDMHGDDLNQWFNYLQSLGLAIDPDLYNKRRINTFAFFSKGNLGTTTNEPLPEESLQLLQRFADTFNLTYTRFQDLKDAEARTEIAIKEASLDRVRGEIASMRTAEDLQRITPLVWRELTALGVPFFRCGVFIVNDEKQKIHFYLSAPDGKPLAALELDFDRTATIQNATAHWREQKVYISHWSKEEFQQFAQDLISQGQIQNVNTYQGGEEAPESLTLQFVPFAQGMMYVGTGEDLSATQIELVQSLADAFSTAYARYEDFTKLEAAKRQVESALKDLRATQAQLIQSEKMASLGELTAGIAHEIQNPLNFVNNFSEVSTELVDEMNEEIKKGNLEDAKQIASDLKDNLTKINHHGKRAGDIVKGMLQHSRSSSGQKEPTDINSLADEYLRLAYHGLRAKDKSFNALMKTDFDESIGMVNLIPQDIGRVILNLITNAFYVVAEKSSLAKTSADESNYEPTVTVTTKKTGDTIKISVKDNGNGIPPKVFDKIFQPFFTTKPTGQGTGLGLSLSYDIVKAHGGELKVETREGEGTEFLIQLPK